MIKWEEDDIPHRYTGTDGFGVIVSIRQADMPDTDFLHINLMIYLENSVEDPRPAVQRAVDLLRKEFGI